MNAVTATWNDQFKIIIFHYGIDNDDFSQCAYAYNLPLIRSDAEFLAGKLKQILDEHPEK